MSDEHPKKGTYVSRSEYQKVVEENRRLHRDIRMMLDEGFTRESMEVRRRWLDKFTQDRMLYANISETLGMWLTTEDGHDVRYGDEVWFCDVSSDYEKHIPGKDIARDLYIRKEKIFFSFDNCQERCNDYNNIIL